MSDDFIEEYPGALDPATCAEIVRAFEASGAAVRGEVGGGVDTRLKDSWDIALSGRPEWDAVRTRLERTAFGGLSLYVKKYRYALLAPLALSIRDAQSGEVKRMDHQALASLPDGEFFALLMHAFRMGSINLQKYVADSGGYPYWHCEHYPKQATVEPLHRVLLWSFYLNDGFADGETEFFYQRRKISPRTGSLLIAPAFFTHTHRGNQPRGGDKYIATSWFLFRTAEEIFGSGGV